MGRSFSRLATCACSRSGSRSRARRAQALVAAVTVPVPADIDLSATVLAARRPDDRFFCLEQPERDGFALATLGTAALLEARGPGRFTELARAQRELAARVFAGEPGPDPGWARGRCSWGASRSRRRAARRRSGRRSRPRSS